jgi:hypothetical protein
MNKQREKANKQREKMNKQIFIPIIVLLAIGLIVVGFRAVQERNRLADVRSELTALEREVSIAQTALAENIVALANETNRRERAQAEIVTQKENLAAAKTALAKEINARELAQAEIVALTTDLMAVSDRLRTVQYPRHFTSEEELTNWLHNDDTNTKDELPIPLAFILQVRALMDGFLLPVSLYWHEGELWVVNRAVIGTNIYSVGAQNDLVERFVYDIDPVPARPIPAN